MDDEQESSSQPKPLQFTSLTDVSKLYDSNNTKGSPSSSARREVLHRLVTKHPTQNEASIVTVLEKIITNDDNKNTGVIQRVAVYSGPDGGGTESLAMQLHASFQLPPEAQPSCICWAGFPTKKSSSSHHAAAYYRHNHPLLCVLIDSTTVSIWDVYPTPTASTNNTSTLSSSSSSDCYSSWTVPLPFECCGMKAIGSSISHKEGSESSSSDGYYGCGLMLQRQADPDDREEESFFLTSPPARRGTGWNEAQAAAPTPTPAPAPAESWMATATSATDTNEQQQAQQQQQQQPDHAPLAVASLFSLQHPLEDVLPVCQVQAEQKNGLAPTRCLPITDVFESLLWIGTADWIDNIYSNYCQRKRQQVVVAVTYHRLKRRHAVWSVQDAPEPPPAPPLYERTRRLRLLRTTGGGGAAASAARSSSPPVSWNNNTGFPDEGLVELGTATMTTGTTTRDEALADALGVRTSRTPRKSMEQHRSSSRRTSEAASLFSPAARSEAAGAAPMEMAAPAAPAVDSTTTTAAPASIWSDASFASIHASVAMQCLYREPDQSSSSAAESIFLVSNPEGSGKTVICLVAERDSCNSSGSKQVRFLQLQATEANDDMEVNDNDNDKNKSATTILPNPKASLVVEPIINGLNCHAAVPIQATPIPATFRPHPKFTKNNEAAVGRNSGIMATDLLVLHSRDNDDVQQNHYLTLFRVNRPIVDCSLPGRLDASLAVFQLADPVQDRVTLICLKAGMPQSFRVKLSLYCSTSALSEKVLSVIDAAAAGVAALDNDDNKMMAWVDLALKIRADVCRLAQRLSASSATDSSLLMLRQDVVWSAVQAVLMHLFELELCGSVTTRTRQANVPQQDADAWNMLLQSEFHHHYSLKNGASLYLGPDTDKKSDGIDEGVHDDPAARQKLASIVSLSAMRRRDVDLLVPSLFDSLHLLYEDCKLSPSSIGDDLPKLGLLLLHICRLVDPHSGEGEMRLFLDYYSRELGKNLPMSPPEVRSLAPLVRREELTSFSAPPSFFLWVDGLMKRRQKDAFYRGVGIEHINAACTKTRSVFRILSALFEGDSPTRDLDVVIALIEEGFTEPSLVREELPPGISLPLLEVLYRCRNDPSLADLPGWTAEAWSLVGRDDLCKNMSGTMAEDDDVSCSGLDVTVTIQDEKADDQEERFLDKDNDGLVPLEKSSAMLFPKDNRIHEAARLLRSSRPIFLRVHRAVEVSDHDYERQKQQKLMILSKRALALPVGRGMLTIGSLRPVAAEPLPLPELCLKGRVPPTNASLALDDSEQPSDLRVWPEFHNGVAAGLRLPRGAKITRTWIVYNKPPRTNQSQSDDDDANPPQHRKGHSHAGLLLALGLRGHLTVLDMSDIYEYLTQGSVTTTVGVLLGMAANKRASCDIALSRMLCLHIPSLIPQHFSAIDVASTVQAAAVAGSGLLFQGSCHRMMTEFLLNELGKRPESEANTFDREAYTLSCGLALGMVLLRSKTGSEDKSAGIADLRVEDRLLRYIVGGTDNDESRRTRETNDRFSLPSASANGDNEKCSTIFEGGSINTDVTAPGATLALGLMYMKTGNQTIASALALPSTHFLLEFVRPDFLALRVISRSLILWNDVHPTNEWIDAQIPVVVRIAYEEMRTIARKAVEGSTTPAKPRRGPEYDRRAIRQMHAHLVAGACFSIGLRFAGTGDERAKSALFERVLELQRLREAKDAVSVASRPEFPILETCLGCAAISLAMVMAGTGDLETLKLFKILRWHCDADSRYGNHMIYGMAIGLLFLGGGTCTIGREPEDIAALVTAFFPRYPTSTSDNQYHLQALRHLYALAVKRKVLCAIDVDTSERVHVSVQIKTVEAMTQPFDLTVPCLLRNTDIALDELIVLSDKYYPLKIKLQKRHALRFFVKKRSMHLPSSITSIMDSEETMLAPGHPYWSAYAKHLVVNGTSGGDFLSRVLRECLLQDSEEAVALYLTLATQPGKIPVWDLRLIRTYYRERHRDVLNTSSTDDSSSSTYKSLLNVDLLIPYLHEMAERSLVSSETQDGMRRALPLYDD